MVALTEQSCPVSGAIGPGCPVGHRAASVSRGRGRSQSQQTRGPRGCSFSGFCQPGDLHAAFNIPQGVDADEWLRMRERKSINQLLYSNIPSVQEIAQHKDQASIDALNANEQDVLAVALGAPARQVMLRAQEIGPKTGWRDGYLSTEHGFCPVDYDASAGALARSPGRVWSDLCERMPGCVARGRVRTTVAALPLVEGTDDVVPDSALWAALVALGLLCSIYRFEDKYDGSDGVTASDTVKTRPNCPMGDDLGEELVGIPLSIALPYLQVSRRMGRALPHLTFVDQSSYNLKIKDVTSNEPYLARFENTELRWPMFGERAEVTFLKGVADTSASFQHGPDAIAACQEHVMNRNVEGLLREMIRLKEILETMPGAFHSISTNPGAGENYVPVQQWVRWAKFSAPLSRRCPASSGLQFPPYLVMDAFLGRKKYSSFLGAEGVHLRAWLPSNLRAFIAAIEYHYRIPEFVAQSGDPRLMGVLDGIVEAYTGERGFMGVHRYKVFGILEVAAKTGRTETNGASGAADAGRPWEETHRQFSEAMKERLEPFRGALSVEPHQMRGTFEECRYVARVQSRSNVDNDANRSIALVTLDIRDTGITFMPGDRLALMPLNSWDECAKVAAALGLQDRLTTEIETKSDSTWGRVERHLASVHRETGPLRKLTVSDILRRGHLAPITQSLALQLHERLQATSRTVLQVLATTSWPVCASLGDVLQAAVLDTPTHVWDRAFGLDDLSWLADLVPPEVPRTYSIASFNNELLPSTVDLAVARSEYSICPALSSHPEGSADDMRAGVSSGFLNPWPARDMMAGNDDVLVGVSRPASFQLPLDAMAPCAFFAGGSGIAPFRSFWQSRLQASGLAGGSNYLFLGVQNRSRFCFEDELRALVGAGFMEVHVAFSRDSHGLSYDAAARDLVEREIQPRYIDALILEQGATVCDLVMSKRQGGRGGNLYICGSVAVFDAVMNGIRRAIYTYRTATMDSVDRIIDKAFAERRIMLDVFMSPKPLPCDRPTIPMSTLAQHTGHRPDSRMWIAVHGSVYDVTDFCPMHPGGTLIIRSNAGGDCSQSFDNLAHTNNPEVSSLLTKYFIGHLTPKPDFHAHTEVSELYDLWAAYLRTAVETLVAHQFEMYEIMGASTSDSSAQASAGSNNIWLQESLPNIIAVRTFYAYQSRLLQGGFAALFGAQLQQLVLRLSFALASTGAASGDTQLPDVLGTVARAKTSPDAAACTREVGRVGAFVCDPEASLRFHERGIAAYATKSVQLDIELLEDLRTEVCNGMDAFERVAAGGLSASNSDDEDAANESMILVLSAFLLQSLERMARRLAVFYAQLAPCSVNHPELEKNPARSRWALVRRYMRDGSLFVLAGKVDNTAATGMEQQDSYYMSKQNPHQPIDFDRLMAQVQGTIGQVPTVSVDDAPARPLTLNAVHQERGRSSGTTSATARRENDSALRAMSLFVEKNRKAIRRLSKLPPTALADLQAMQNNADDLAQQARQQLQMQQQQQQQQLQQNNILGLQGSQIMQEQVQTLNTRGRGQLSQLRQAFGDGRAISQADARLLAGSRPPSLSRSSSRSSHDSALYPVIGGPVAPPIDAHQAMLAAMARMNTRASESKVQSQMQMQNRSRSASVVGGSRTRSPSILSHERMASVTSMGSVYRTKSMMSSQGHVRNESGSWLRSFKLKGMVEANERKVAPTF